MRDEGFAYADALKEAGWVTQNRRYCVSITDYYIASVPVTVKVYPGLPHGFYQFPELEQSVMYHQSVTDWINMISKRESNVKTG